MRFVISDGGIGKGELLLQTESAGDYDCAGVSIFEVVCVCVTSAMLSAESARSLIEAEDSTERICWCCTGRADKKNLRSIVSSLEASFCKASSSDMHLARDFDGSIVPRDWFLKYWLKSVDCVGWRDWSRAFLKVE